MNIVEKVEQAFLTALRVANNQLSERELYDLLFLHLEPLRLELLALHNAGRSRKVGW